MFGYQKLQVSCLTDLETFFGKQKCARAMAQGGFKRWELEEFGSKDMPKEYKNKDFITHKEISESLLKKKQEIFTKSKNIKLQMLAQRIAELHPADGIRIEALDGCLVLNVENRDALVERGNKLMAKSGSGDGMLKDLEMRAKKQADNAAAAKAAGKAKIEKTVELAVSAKILGDYAAEKKAQSEAALAAFREQQEEARLLKAQECEAKRQAAARQVAEAKAARAKLEAEYAEHTNDKVSRGKKKMSDRRNHATLNAGNAARAAAAREEIRNNYITMMKAKNQSMTDAQDAAAERLRLRKIADQERLDAQNRANAEKFYQKKVYVTECLQQQMDDRVRQFDESMDHYYAVMDMRNEHNQLRSQTAAEGIALNRERAMRNYKDVLQHKDHKFDGILDKHNVDTIKLAKDRRWAKIMQAKQQNGLCEELQHYNMQRLQRCRQTNVANILLKFAQQEYVQKTLKEQKRLAEHEYKIEMRNLNLEKEENDAVLQKLKAITDLNLLQKALDRTDMDINVKKIERKVKGIAEEDE